MSKNVSANVTGVVELLRNYFLRYPNSKPGSACRFLHLEPRRYGGTARVVKSRVKQTWGGVNVKGDSLNALTSTHRRLYYLVGGVPDGPVLSGLLSAASGGSNRDDTWYSSLNRNGQLNYRSNHVAVRVLPSTRRLEVLVRDPCLTGVEVREEFERILFSGLNDRLPDDHDAAHVARDLSYKLAPKEVHRRFVIPPGPYYKLRFYEDTLGLVILRDLSEHMNEQEAIEKMPPWISDVLDAVDRMASGQREIVNVLQQVKRVLLQRQKANVNGNVQIIQEAFRGASV